MPLFLESILTSVKIALGKDVSLNEPSKYSEFKSEQ